MTATPGKNRSHINNQIPHSSAPTGSSEGQRLQPTRKKQLVVGMIKIQVYRKPPKPTTKRLDVSSVAGNTNIAAKYNPDVSNKFEPLGAFEES